MKYVLVFIFIKKKIVLSFAPPLGSNPGSVPIAQDGARDLLPFAQLFTSS